MSTTISEFTYLTEPVSGETTTLTAFTYTEQPPEVPSGISRFTYLEVPVRRQEFDFSFNIDPRYQDYVFQIPKLPKLKLSGGIQPHSFPPYVYKVRTMGYVGNEVTEIGWTTFEALGGNADAFCEAAPGEYVVIAYGATTDDYGNTTSLFEYRAYKISAPPTTLPDSAQAIPALLSLNVPAFYGDPTGVPALLSLNVPAFYGDPTGVPALLSLNVPTFYGDLVTKTFQTFTFGVNQLCGDFVFAVGEKAGDFSFSVAQTAGNFSFNAAKEVAQDSGLFTFLIDRPLITSYQDFSFSILSIVTVTTDNLFEFSVVESKRTGRFAWLFDITTSVTPVTIYVSTIGREGGYITPKAGKHRINVRVYAGNTLICAGTSSYLWTGPGNAHVEITLKGIPEISPTVRIDIFDDGRRCFSENVSLSGPCWSGVYGKT